MHQRLACLAIAVMLVAACDPGTSSSTGSGQGSSPQQSAGDPEARYVQAGKPFADAIMKRDYPRAYAMLSPRLSAIMPLADFEAVHRQALSDYFVPAQADEPWVVESEPLALAGQVDPAGDELSQAIDRMTIARYVGEVPSVIPTDIRRASVTVPFYNSDPDDDDVRCFYLTFLLVEDEGQLKVGHFFYRWHDMLD